MLCRALLFLKKKTFEKRSYDILHRDLRRAEKGSDFMNQNKLVRRSYPLYLLLPAVLIFTVFYTGAIIASFYYSFTNWSIFNVDNYTFTGFTNIELLLEDEKFKIAIINVFLFNIGTTFFKTLFGLGLGLWLNMKFRGRNLFRTIFYLPCILSPLVIGYIFKFVLHPDGLLNDVLTSIGLSSLTSQWFGDASMAMFSVGIVEVWTWSGFCAVIFLAGLQSIPMEILEAASIDGANIWQSFRHIKFPDLRPSFTIVVILNVIGGFKVFGLVMATTNGGPGCATEVFSTLVYKQQAQGLFGYASAIGLVQFLVIAVVTIPTLLLLKRWEES